MAAIAAGESQASLDEVAGMSDAIAGADQRAPYCLRLCPAS